MEGISITKLLLIAVVVILLFGTNKLRTLGNDLGAALKGFKKAIHDDKLYESEPDAEKPTPGDVHSEKPVQKEE